VPGPPVLRHWRSLGNAERSARTEARARCGEQLVAVARVPIRLKCDITITRSGGFLPTGPTTLIVSVIYVLI
jgi:hypothetical protein